MTAPLCECGCGEPVTRRSRSPKTWNRYLIGHRNRTPNVPACGYVVDETGCWLWGRGVRPDGYGRKSGSNVPAHKLLWVERNGPVPAGYELDHLCRVKHCVNPDHLEPVTHTENVRRGGAAKLSLDVADAIRADQRSTYKIAAAYGVCQTTIVQIKQGKTWVRGAESPGGIGPGESSGGLRMAS